MRIEAGVSAGQADDLPRRFWDATSRLAGPLAVPRIGCDTDPAGSEAAGSAEA